MLLFNNFYRKEADSTSVYFFFLNEFRSLKLPYPILSIEANGAVISQKTEQVFVPYKYLYIFNEARTAHVSFEGYDNMSYQFDVKSHRTKLVHKEDSNYVRGNGYNEYL